MLSNDYLDPLESAIRARRQREALIEEHRRLNRAGCILAAAGVACALLQVGALVYVLFLGG